MTGTLLSIGHGYVAQALAQALPEGWRIIATTRSADKARALAETGVEALVWPGADLAPALEHATHVLSSVAPTEAGDPVLARLGPSLAQARQARWVGYLSTTGVYGDHGGDWVDEDTPLAPGTQRGLARVRAEAGWQALDLPLHLFRLSGIYGPGRSAFDRLRDGTAQRIVKPGQVFSRIHVDDIAQALAASMARPMPGAIWNLGDDLPAPPQDVIAHAAQLLGIDPPPEVPFDEADLSPMARSFYSESKKLCNARVKRDLRLTLRHPDYRAGLAAILAAENENGQNA